MTGRYKAYPDLSTTGEVIIEDFPEHWNLTRIKFNSLVKARVGWHGLKSDDFTDVGPYLVTGSDFKGKFIQWKDCYHCDVERYEQDPYIQLTNGDLLITKDGTIGKVALVSELDGKATLNSGVFVVRPLRSDFTTQYYYWLLLSRAFTDFVDYYKTGSTIAHLYQETFVNFKYPLPPYEEQQKIASFLDHETAKIDTLITKQEKLIELLKEKRQAMISHAVTKGLNPDAPMKDSGVAWLGEVPEHWSVGRLKNVLRIRNGKDYKHIEVESGGYPVYGSGGIFKRSSEYLFDGESVLFGRKGTIDKPLVVKGKFWTVDTMFYSELNKYTDAHYVHSQSTLFPFDLLSTNTALPSMTQEDLLELGFVIPPFEEQLDISKAISKQNNKFANIIEKASKQIDLMKERKTALISAAVTGKIDVRDWDVQEVQE